MAEVTPVGLQSVPRDPPYRHIGCCIDDSPETAAAIAHARALWTPGGRLSLVHAAPHALIFDSVGGSESPSPRDINARRRDWLTARVEEIPGSEGVFLEGLPGPEICGWAQDSAVDLLIAARHGGGRGITALGSVVRHLVDHAPCPVLVITRPRDVGPAAEPDGPA